MLKNKILRKVLAVTLSAAMLGGTGFTTAGQFIGTSGISASAAATATDLKYFSYKGSSIYSYNGTETAITVPAKSNEGTFFTTTGGISQLLSSRSTVTDVKFESGNKITAIGANAFGGSKLKSITLPANLTTIGDSAFYNCTSLEKIVIPATVTSIGKNAFRGCTALKTVIIQGNAESMLEIGEFAFSGCTALKTVTIQGNAESTLAIGNYAFHKCTSLDSINLTNRVKAIGDSAFENCTALKTINIPGTVEKISYAVFENCTNLQTITINQGVASVYDRAFYNCTNLTEIKLPNSVTYIGASTLSSSTYPDNFFGCSSLKRLVIPNKDIALTNAECFRGINSNVIIYGVEGSKASQFATDKKLSFRPILENKTKLSTTNVVALNNYVTITPSAAGGYGDISNYEYKVDLKKNGGTAVNKLSWTKKSSQNSFKIKFTEKGSYEIIVTICDENGLEETAVFPMKVVEEDEPFTVKATLSAENITLNKSVKVNVAANGGNPAEKYFYDAELRKATDENFTHTSKDYSDTTTSFSFTPKETGDYVVRVRVVNGTRDSKGNVTGKIIEKYLNFSVCENLKNLSDVSVTGNTVTVNTKASGGKETYTYNVYYKSELTSSANWISKYKEFQKINEVTLTLKDAGVYNICVKAKDANGTIAKKYFSVTPEMLNNSKISATSIKLGNTLTATAVASGGAGNYTYAVYYKQKAQSKWTVKQDFDVNNIVSVKPAKTTDYDICIKAKDSDGTIVKKYFTVNVTA